MAHERSDDDAMTEQVDAVRRRLVESQHLDWIAQLHLRTGWPRNVIVDTLIAAECDQQRLHDAYESFRNVDNLNPFTTPPPHERFLQFVRQL